MTDYKEKTNLRRGREIVIYKVNLIVKNLLIPLLLLLTNVEVNRIAGSADRYTNALSINL
jgi:hypothetical protein